MVVRLCKTDANPKTTFWMPCSVRKSQKQLKRVACPESIERDWASRVALWAAWAIWPLASSQKCLNYVASVLFVCFCPKPLEAKSVNVGSSQALTEPGGENPLSLLLSLAHVTGCKVCGGTNHTKPPGWHAMNWMLDMQDYQHVNIYIYIYYNIQLYKQVFRCFQRYK